MTDPTVKYAASMFRGFEARWEALNRRLEDMPDGDERVRLLAKIDQGHSKKSRVSARGGNGGRCCGGPEGRRDMSDGLIHMMERVNHRIVHLCDGVEFSDAEYEGPFGSRCEDCVAEIRRREAAGRVVEEQLGITAESLPSWAVRDLGRDA